MYIWERKQWPEFRWDASAVQGMVSRYAMEAGALKGGLAQSGADEELIDLMVSEAVHTSAIEGEDLERDDVRSSLLNQMGLGGSAERDPRTRGIASLMLSVRRTLDRKLTMEQVLEWHDMLFSDPGQRERIAVGRWREGEVRVVSGPMGREVVHFVGPPASRVSTEMAKLVDWLNRTGPHGGREDLPGPVRAGIAHLWFECIHPFDDGNGRIGRALAEMVLSQELGRPALLSLSTIIDARRRAYYAALGAASKGGLEVTPWLSFFVESVLDAQLQARSMVDFVLAKTRFWDRWGQVVNERQAKVLSRMLREGPGGFEGGMSARKYVSITGCSKATATRDLTELLEKGVLQTTGSGGRSTSYEIVMDRVPG